jgi:uracil-DNA glycosylase
MRPARKVHAASRGAGGPVTIPYEALRAFRSRHVFNPWAERDPLDAAGEAEPSGFGPDGRLSRLRAHFAVAPALVLLGEASGYQGCHFSGMPFTNEKLLLAGRIPRVRVPARLTTRPRPWCEPSATVVWGTLHALGLADRTVLWNAFAWHPFKPGDPYSNRAPTREELEAGRDVLDGVLDTFARARVVAVGKVAERTLRGLGREPYATLRHPSMGGANEFRTGLATLAARLGLAMDAIRKATSGPRRRRGG